MEKSLIGCTSAKLTDPFGELKIFTGSASRSLTEEVCSYLHTEISRSEALTFSEGNVFVRILENVRGRDVFIFQGTEFPVNDNFMELLFWVDAFKRASAVQVTAVIPFFSYAKGDKKDEPRVSIRARVCADCIEAAGADRVLTMDLHSPQIQGFFKIPVDHLHAMPVLADYFKKRNIPDLVVASPDVGFAKQASRFAHMMNADLVIGNKTRKDHSERAEIFDFIGEVKGKNVLIIDDFTISGGTLIEMANACVARGAKDVYACVSHGAFAKGTAERIQASPIRELVVTNTIQARDRACIPSNCTIVSVAPMFAEAILSIHRRESVSRLFQEWGGP